MATQLQITIDCADPGLLARFWATALHYQLEPPPAGHATWRDFYLSIGVDEAELGDLDSDAVDRVIDPAGAGPRMWFQQVPEAKAGKNRLHLDLRVSDGRAVPVAQRREQVEAEVARLEAAGASRAWTHDDSTGVDHYAVTMRDPEGNEFCVV